jgi:uncharacterized protein (UPF0264 family)
MIRRLTSSGSTRLLVSVASPTEAAAALAGGADVVDAKDPTAGALGRASVDVLAEIHSTICGRATVTAALGDASDINRTERLAAQYASRGAGFVKLGFAGITDGRRVDALLAAAVRGCALGGRATGVVAVAYADAATVGSIDAMSLVDIAARTGARGVLVDTADKQGDGLTTLWTAMQIASWVAEARKWGLIAAVAGKLSPDDLAIVRDAGADVVGVRGAACIGGRTGEVSAARVRALRVRIDEGSAPAAPCLPSTSDNQSTSAARSSSSASPATTVQAIPGARAVAK